MNFVPGLTGPYIDSKEIHNYSHDVIIRLAYEGMPLRAIARAVKRGSDDIREIARDALAAGSITQMPPEDWKPGTSPTQRAPAEFKVTMDHEDGIMHLMRLYVLTRQEAAIFLALIKKGAVSRDNLHDVIEARRAQQRSDLESTEPKIVDVVICKLRGKLKRYGLTRAGGGPVIQTQWGEGYFIDLADRQRIRNEVRDFALRETGAVSPGIEIEETATTH